MLAVFALIACGAKKLQVFRLIRSAARQWHDVIDMIFSFPRFDQFDLASRTLPRLYVEEVRDIDGSMRAESTFLPGPAIALDLWPQTGVRFKIAANLFRIILLPLESLLSTFGEMLIPIIQGMFLQPVAVFVVIIQAFLTPFFSILAFVFSGEFEHSFPIALSPASPCCASLFWMSGSPASRCRALTLSLFRFLLFWDTLICSHSVSNPDRLVRAAPMLIHRRFPLFDSTLKSQLQVF